MGETPSLYFVLDVLSIEKGELTPTHKLRREVLLDKYEELIATMYGEREEDGG